MAQEDSWKFWRRENEVDKRWIQFVDDNALEGQSLHKISGKLAA